MTNLPASVRSTRLLILVNGVLWLAFGLLVAFGAHPSYKELGPLRWAMAAAAFLAAGLLAALEGLLMKHNRRAYWLEVALLSFMGLAAVFDEFGLADLAFLIITLVPLALLVRDRPWYLQPNGPPPSTNRPA